MMPRAILASFRSSLLVCALMVGASCGRSRATTSAGEPTAPVLQRDQRVVSFDATPLYRQMGMIARGQPFPVVGRTAFLPGATRDSAHVVLVLGFAPAALRFTRETDNRYRANYTVAIRAEREGQAVFSTETTETVVLGAFRETERGDESIVYQEIFDLAPGTYRLSLTLRDVSSQRGVVEQVDLTVPDFGAAALGTPLPVNRVVPRETRDSLPYLLARPRATASLGQDSVLPMYIESASAGDSVLQVLVRGESGRQLFTASAAIARATGFASGIVQLPVNRLGVGVSQVSFIGSRGRDTSSVYVFVGFGDDLPIARFEDMLQFLRYFARPARLQTLREAAEEDRPAAWARFIRETDSIPNTAANEDLRTYFLRLVRANARFREDGGAGWMSDRGRVFIVLGEPDQILEPSFTNIRQVRQQIWQYTNRGLQLQFFDQTGAGRWQLAQNSASRFEAELRRQLR